MLGQYIRKYSNHQSQSYANGVIKMGNVINLLLSQGCGGYLLGDGNITLVAAKRSIGITKCTWYLEATQRDNTILLERSKFGEHHSYKVRNQYAYFYTQNLVKLKIYSNARFTMVGCSLERICFIQAKSPERFFILLALKCCSLQIIAKVVETLPSST